MKKSRIIIPALAAIAFSVAASVTGTVAWFTTRRTATVNAGTYAVVKTSANLDVVASEGFNTTATNDQTLNTHVVAFETNAVLTDASFNHKTGKIYQPNEFGDDWHPTYPAVDYNDASEAPAATLAEKLTRGTLSNGGKIYSAAEFQLTFRVLFGSSAGDYGLFLDHSAANKTNFKAYAPTDTAHATPLSGSAIKTAKGFRMAFVSEDYPNAQDPSSPINNGRNIVLADLQDNGTWDHDGDAGVASLEPPQTPTAEVNKIRHVNNNGSDFNKYGNPTNYVAEDHDLIYNGLYTGMPAAGAITATQAAQRPDYLGIFNFAENKSAELKFTVVCWFEGTDPEIVNRSLEEEYQTVVSELHFEAIKLHA